MNPAEVNPTTAGFCMFFQIMSLRIFTNEQKFVIMSEQ